MQRVSFFWALLVVVTGFTPVCGFSSPGTDSNKVLHVYFKFNSARVETKDVAALKKAVSWFKQVGKNYKIQISGYCDCVGSNAYNDKLSRKRGAAVKKALINLGIGAGSITEINAYGKRKPLNENKTVAERRANRRVDIEAVANGNEPQYGLSFLKKGGKTGAHIILKDLDFVGGMHTLLPEFLPQLDTLVEIMKLHPTLEIKILGFVCCQEGVGDGYDFETKTWDLSRNRAKVVYDYLIAHRINKNRLSFNGMGAAVKLVNPELTEQDKTLNRRVEVVIVKE